MTEDFWKSKLKAFLHDPPNKCFDIAGHEKAAASAMKAAGFSEEEINGAECAAGLPDYRKMREADKFCDRTASAADRFLFPHSRKMNARFTGGKDAPFLHPFCPGRFYTEKPVSGAALAEEKFQDAIGSVDSSLSWKNLLPLIGRTSGKYGMPPGTAVGLFSWDLCCDIRVFTRNCMNCPDRSDILS